jgi:hypothetical protein
MGALKISESRFQPRSGFNNGPTADIKTLIIIIATKAFRLITKGFCGGGLFFLQWNYL